MTSTTIYLIRHGQIDANVAGHWHGSTDSPLNETGREQAQLMGRHVSGQHPDIAAIYASPLQRTTDTARALAREMDLDVIAEPGFREYGIGELEGEAYQELRDRHGFFTSIAEDQGFAPPGGESPRDVRDRMVEAFSQVVSRHSGESVAVVSHGAAMGILLATLLHDRILPFHDYHMQNTGFSRVDGGPAGVPSLVFFNETVHLD